MRNIDLIWAKIQIACYCSRSLSQNCSIGLT